jgi:hypothetical protein
MMSKAVATYALVGAVQAIDDFLGKNHSWNPVNDTQQCFLIDYFEQCRNEIARIPELESVASKQIDEINLFLESHRYSRISGKFLQDEVGAVSILDLRVEWTVPGTATTIRPLLSQREYPAVSMPRNAVSFWKSPIHGSPIAKLVTKSGDMAFLTMADGSPSGFDLVSQVQRISNSLQANYDFNGLIFPMVDLQQGAVVSWLSGLRATIAGRGAAIIKWAFQHAQFRMNELGAHAESVAVLRAPTSSLRRPQIEPHIISKPFLVWFQREGLRKPLFVCYVSEEDWKQPVLANP